MWSHSHFWPHRTTHVPFPSTLLLKHSSTYSPLTSIPNYPPFDPQNVRSIIYLFIGPIRALFNSPHSEKQLPLFRRDSYHQIMAAPFPNRHPPSTEPNSATPNSPRIRDWGRTGEPGSAFNGLTRTSRGRGMPNRGNRGGRGGRGRPPTEPSNNIPHPPKVDHSSKTKVAPSPAIPPKPTIPQTPVISTPTNTAKVKPTSNRASRVNPILVVDSSSITEQAPSSATGSPSPRPPNRRRRSQQHNKVPPAAVAKLDVPNSHFPRIRRSRSGPASPSSATLKDIPPHLTPSEPSFEARTDIDALVERVRAVAMAENRPTTPGSHIDWAGDEDDTLPDLDDWGVATDSNSLAIGMSPLSVDGLTSLPEPAVQPPVVTQSRAIRPTTVVNPNSNINNSIPISKQNTLPNAPPQVSNAPSFLNDRRNLTRAHAPKPLQLNDHKPVIEGSQRFPILSAPYDHTFGLGISPPPKPHTSTSEHFKLPLHPSLPPKPVSAVETQPKPGIGAVPMRTPVPVMKPVENLEAKAAFLVIPPVDQQHTKLDIPVNPVPQDIVQSVPPPSSDYAPPSTEGSLQEGLAESIHAPKDLSPAASQISRPLNNVSSPTFNPTHSRNHLVGPLCPPYSVNGFARGFSRSGSSTPR